MTLEAVMLSVVYADCHAERCKWALCAECRYAECRGALYLIALRPLENDERQVRVVDVLIVLDRPAEVLGAVRAGDAL